MTLRLVWARRAERDARKLEADIYRRILLAVRRFAETGQGDVVLLAGIRPPEWRLRVGDYRVRFRLRGDVLEVLRVAHRREVYR